MIYTIHLEATANGDAACAALARAPGGEVALAFPRGSSCALSDARQLEALYAVCSARDIQLVIVGGDQQLRAHAVAAGFAAATSIEEWETAKHRAVRSGREAANRSPRAGERTAQSGPEIRVVTHPKRRAAQAGEDLYSLDGEDPPGYVSDLVERERAEREEHHAAVPTLPLQRGRATRILSETARDRREAEALERAHQLFEERLTAMIRHTGPLTPPNGANDVGGHENGAGG